MRWRMIFTDSESLTGVAPVCDDPTGLHLVADFNAEDVNGVYDCCPHPHIECWTERAATDIAQRLNEAEAGMAGA